MTPLRAKLRWLVKQQTNVNKVWVTGGRIKCTLNAAPGFPATNDVHIIESPDDLFKIGVNLDNVGYKKLGLEHLLVYPSML